MLFYRKLTDSVISSMKTTDDDDDDCKQIKLSIKYLLDIVVKYRPS
jgi:hypothetical protein